MYLAVKRADANHPKRLPIGYPCLCRELEDDQPLPNGYERMSVEDLAKDKLNFQDAYQKWVVDVCVPYERKIEEIQATEQLLQDECNELIREENRQPLSPEKKARKQKFEKDLDDSSYRQSLIKH